MNGVAGDYALRESEEKLVIDSERMHTSCTKRDEATASARSVCKKRAHAEGVWGI